MAKGVDVARGVTVLNKQRSQTIEEVQKWINPFYIESYEENSLQMAIRNKLNL